VRYPTMESRRRAISQSSIGGISISNGTMGAFCHTLEQVLDRPVVDETGLAGRYDIALPEDQSGTSEFIERLRTQLGLALTPGRRDVTTLVVRPAVEERDLGLNTDPR
jgi:uncharacterized protein (TIGR03435 family)